MLEGVMHDFRQNEYRVLSCQAVLCMTFVREPENYKGVACRYTLQTAPFIYVPNIYRSRSCSAGDGPV